MKNDKGNINNFGRKGAQNWWASTEGWFLALRRYLLLILVGNVVWEVAQLPLFTIWYTGTPGEIVFAVLHCTGGDLLIAGFALLGSLLISRDKGWPYASFTKVAILTILSGLAYTIYSEWHNTEILRNWAYSDLMPTLPLTGTGTAPFLQWLLVPSLAFWWASRGLVPTSVRYDSERQG